MARKTAGQHRTTLPNSKRKSRAISLESIAEELELYSSTCHPPKLEQIKADCRWAQAQIAAGAFRLYQGSHVLILDRKVIAHGPNALLLQLEAARDKDLHPDRFVIVYVEPSEPI